MSDLSPSDWRPRLKILSLDFVRPVYAELGLAVQCEDTLRGLARDALTGRLAAEFGAGDRAASAEAHPDESRTIAAFLKGVERLFGAAGRQRVRYWVEYTAFWEDSNPWALYKRLMSTWATGFRTSGSDAIGFSADPAIVERELRLAWDLADAEAALDERRRRPLTDWDFPLFCELELLEIPEGSDYFPFVDTIILTVRMHRFHMFWRWLRSFLPEGDLRKLGSHAEALARKGGVNFVPPEDLPLEPH